MNVRCVEGTDGFFSNNSKNEFILSSAKIWKINFLQVLAIISLIQNSLIYGHSDFSAIYPNEVIFIPWEWNKLSNVSLSYILK